MYSLTPRNRITRLPLPHLSWGRACLFPLTSLLIILTTIGSSSHIYFPDLSNPFRLALLAFALPLPHVAIYNLDWSAKSSAGSTAFFVLEALFAISTWTSIYDFDVDEGGDSKLISGGQRVLVYLSLVVYSLSLVIIGGQKSWEGEQQRNAPNLGSVSLGRFDLTLATAIVLEGQLHAALEARREAMAGKRGHTTVRGGGNDLPEYEMMNIEEGGAEGESLLSGSGTDRQKVAAFRITFTGEGSQVTGM